MITPPVQHFTTHATCQVVIPQWHTKTALEGHPEEAGRNVSPCTTGWR